MKYHGSVGRRVRVQDRAKIDEVEVTGERGRKDRVCVEERETHMAGLDDKHLERMEEDV